MIMLKIGKISFILLYMLLYNQATYAQNLPLFMKKKYVVLEATIGQSEVAEEAINKGGYLIFYPFDGNNELIYMAETRPGQYTQSYGPISELTSEKEIINENQAELIRFYWDYSNTHKSNKAKSKVVLIHIHRDGQTIFYMTIVPESGEEIKYFGLVVKE